MKIVKRHLFVALILIQLLGIIVTSCRPTTSPGPPHTWTILVYLDGDNELANAALVDFAEMRIASSSDYVNVIVQLDLPNFVPARRYRISHNQAVLLSEPGEVDMSAPGSLTDFLVWAKASYPSDRTVLILWDHGNGWDQGDGPSSPAPGIRRSMFLDTDNNGANGAFLPNHYIRKAIEAAGIKLDVLGMDACNMATFEAIYEFRTVADVIVSSQEDEPSSGWDYTGLLNSLAAHPEMSVDAFGAAAVESYRLFFENVYYPLNPNDIKRYTLSAIRTTNLDPLAQEVDNLAGMLSAKLADPATVAETITAVGAARSGAQEIDPYIKPHVYVDLKDLDRLLNQGTAIPQLLAGATIAEYHGADRPNASGMSIVFFGLPDAKTSNTFDVNYKDYDGATNTGNGGDFINLYRWDEFLAAYYSAAGL